MVKKRKKSKSFNKGDGFDMEAYQKEKKSRKEREARRFEKRYGRFEEK